MTPLHDAIMQELAHQYVVIKLLTLIKFRLSTL